jgi:hypothetical protein
LCDRADGLAELLYVGVVSAIHTPTFPERKLAVGCLAMLEVPVKLPIVDITSPTCFFTDAEAFQAHRADASRYQLVVDAYADGALHEDNVWHALAGLGFAVDEIEWHINHPGKRMVQNFTL